VKRPKSLYRPGEKSIGKQTRRFIAGVRVPLAVGRFSAATPAKGLPIRRRRLSFTSLLRESVWPASLGIYISCSVLGRSLLCITAPHCAALRAFAQHSIRPLHGVEDLFPARFLQFALRSLTAAASAEQIDCGAQFEQRISRWFNAVDAWDRIENDFLLLT
jgi:hypothetical protein